MAIKKPDNWENVKAAAERENCLWEHTSAKF